MPVRRRHWRNFRHRKTDFEYFFFLLCFRVSLHSEGLKSPPLLGAIYTYCIHRKKEGEAHRARPSERCGLRHPRALLFVENKHAGSRMAVLLSHKAPPATCVSSVSTWEGGDKTAPSISHDALVVRETLVWWPSYDSCCDRKRKPD